MTGWLDDLLARLNAGAPCLLVTVLAVEGSAPREPGGTHGGERGCPVRHHRGRTA